MSRSYAKLWQAVACTCFALICGCSLGPKRIRSDWRQYNQSVVDVENQELLLNLVRLRYNEYPGVLRISNITAQRNWSTSGTIGATFPWGGANSATAAINGLKSERPTVSFSPGSSAKLSAALTPVSLDVLYLAGYMGWPPSVTWPLMIKSINDVNNTPIDHGQMPGVAEATNEFHTIALSLRSLKDQGLVEVGRIEKLVPVGDEIDADSVSGADRVAAAESGHVFVDSALGDGLILSKKKQVPVLRFAPDVMGLPEHKALVEMLDLDPNATTFELEPAFEGSLKQEDVPRQDIELGMRSLFEMLFLLSRGVQVPDCDVTCGVAPPIVTRPESEAIAGHFVVQCCDQPPRCASVVVEYRGRWFYIDMSDQHSKATFFLLKLIYDTHDGVADDDGAPVLTLPL